MHPDIDELRPKLKEILYDCAVEIKATKAALYLLDPAIRKFELVTEYGFRSAIPQSANYNHPIIDRTLRSRAPFYVNSVGADPKLSQLLFDTASERLLVAPILSRGDMVGFVDMRDKAGKASFDQADVPKAQTVVEKILNVFASRNIFNQRFVTLADVQISDAPTAPVAAVKETPAPAPAPSAPVADQNLDFIADAKEKSRKIIVPPAPRTVGEGEMRAVRDVLRSVLYLPGSLVAAFTATGPAGSIQEIAAKNTMAEDARNELHAKLQTWLSKRGESIGTVKAAVQTPFGEAGSPISAAQMVKVYTAPVTAGEYRGLYLTVAFAETPGRSTHELLAALLNQLVLAIEVSNSRDAVEMLRSRAAARILEPEFTSFPELRRHSEAVAGRAAAFAQYLDLMPHEVETVTLAALVHDAGLRVMDYDRLYTKREVTAAEIAYLRQHVFVSAAMVEPILGHEIARAVLCHHERVDGAGYPNELHGEDIPLASRIMQICDTYATVTMPSSYQKTMTHAEGMALITRGAGGQFDAGLVGKFVEMMGK